MVVDNPTRQSFVGELVGPDLIRNAVSLNSTIFQLGGLVGPSIAGLLIGTLGAGWAFAINAATYLPVLIALTLIDPGRLCYQPAAAHDRSGQVREGLHYIHERPRLLWLVVLVGVVGCLGLNMPVVLTTYATTVFHTGPMGYGVMTSMLAVGSVHRSPAVRPADVDASALGRRRRRSLRRAAGARRPRARPRGVRRPAGRGRRGVADLPHRRPTPPCSWARTTAVRGRVMAVYLLVLLGGTPFGGPLVGLITAHVGDRFGMLVCGIAPVVAAVVVAGRLRPTLASRPA